MLHVNNCTSRWLNFLNAPKPTDSLSSCTVGKQRMTWFSPVFTSFSSQLSSHCHLYLFLIPCENNIKLYCIFWKRFFLGITEMVSSSGILSKSLDGQARVCSSSHRRVSQWKKASFLDVELLNNYETTIDYSHFRETGMKQKRYDRVWKDCWCKFDITLSCVQGKFIARDPSDPPLDKDGNYR